MPLVDELAGHGQGVEVPDAQQVELDPAQFLALPHVQLGGDDLVLGPAHRDCPQQGRGGHQDSGGVHTAVPDQPGHLLHLGEQLRVLQRPRLQLPALAGDQLRPRQVGLVGVVGVFEPLHRRDVFADGFQVGVATRLLVDAQCAA